MVDNFDKDLLEFVANDEPWHIVCKTFRPKLQVPAELISRVVRLRDAGLITFRPASAVSADDLLADALANNWHKDTDWPNGPLWNIVTTEQWFQYVRDRFNKHDT
jgi:hypothetical protein